MNPNSVHLWLPRGDEHQLAASLGLCEKDPELARERLEAAQEDIARRLPGVPVIVHRWHVWRIIRAMQRVGVLNTPDGRAAAVAWLGQPGSGI